MAGCTGQRFLLEKHDLVQNVNKTSFLSYNRYFENAGLLMIQDFQSTRSMEG